MGKKTKVKFGTTIRRTKGFLIMCILMFGVPLRMHFSEGNTIFFSFVDDYSRRNWVYTMSHKSQVLGIFVEWRRRMELQTNRKLKILRSDNGGEYNNDSFLQLCRDENIKQHFTVRETSQQNGWQKDLTVPYWRRYLLVVK